MGVRSEGSGDLIETSIHSEALPVARGPSAIRGDAAAATWIFCGGEIETRIHSEALPVGWTFRGQGPSKHKRARFVEFGRL